MLSFSKPFWQTISSKLGPHPQSTLFSVERLLASLFPTISGPCDTQDFSSAVDRLVTEENAIFLFDMVFDGVDLTSAAFEKMSELVGKSVERVEQCSCTTDEGCFRCIANPLADEPASKTATVVLLKAIQSVLDSVQPERTNKERDWDSAFEAQAERPCGTCGHPVPNGAKFCSECGSKIEG